MPEETGVNQSMSQMLRSWLPMQFGSPVSWEVALNKEHLKRLAISSAPPALDCAKPGGSCPGWLFLASGSHTATLQSSVHTLMNQTRSYSTSSRPCRKEGLAGDGPCRDEELLAPIFGLIFVSLPFVLLLSGLQRMLYVRSSSPWQKPALKDWDYNKVVQLSV